MNILKRLFISLYVSFLFVANGAGVYFLLNTNEPLAWLASLIATGPFLVFLMYAFVSQKVSRTQAKLNWVLAAHAIAAGLSLLAYNQQQGSASALLSVLLSLGFYVLYDYWYSDLNRSNSTQIANGQTLPEFEATQADGSVFNTQSLLGKPAVFIFFRGNWCPFCVAQVKELAAEYRQIEQFGANVCFISPQNVSETAKLAAKFDIPALFLSDIGNKAAKILGIEGVNGLPAGLEVLGYDQDTVLPTVLVTDANGIIIYNDQTSHYRVRPEPSEFLAVLQNA